MQDDRMNEAWKVEQTPHQKYEQDKRLPMKDNLPNQALRQDRFFKGRTSKILLATLAVSGAITSGCSNSLNQITEPIFNREYCGMSTDGDKVCIRRNQVSCYKRTAVEDISLYLKREDVQQRMFQEANISLGVFGMIDMLARQNESNYILPGYPKGVILETNKDLVHLAVCRSKGTISNNFGEIDLFEEGFNRDSTSFAISLQGILESHDYICNARQYKDSQNKWLTGMKAFGSPKFVMEDRNTFTCHAARHFHLIDKTIESENSSDRFTGITWVKP